MLRAIKSLLHHKQRDAKKVAVVLGASAAILSLSLFIHHRRRKHANRAQSNTNQRHKTKLEPLGKYESLKVANFDSPVSLHYKDKEQFFAKLEKFRKLGPNHLQIVSDFDYTISSFKLDGKPSESLFGTFRLSKHTSEAFKQGTSALFKKYSPIEIDEKIQFDEKQRLLTEWYVQVKEFYLKENIDTQKTLKILNEGNIGIRFGFDQLLRQCASINLPFYIVSGGITNLALTVVNELVNLKKYPNLFVYSNDLIFNPDNGKLTDMVMNVDATSKPGVLSRKKFNFRKHTLLFGDLITDYEMASQMGSEEVLAIAFLDPERKHALEVYKEKFDLVILGDGNFLPHERILGYVLGEGTDIDYERKMQVVLDEPYKEIIERLK